MRAPANHVPRHKRMTCIIAWIAYFEWASCVGRVRPFFKVFEAQLCADRYQRAEYEGIKFFEFVQRLPLPLANFRLNFVCYKNVRNI